MEQVQPINIGGSALLCVYPSIRRPYPTALEKLWDQQWISLIRVPKKEKLAHLAGE